MPSLEQKIYEVREPIVRLPQFEYIGGKIVSPIGLGTAAYAAGEPQDQLTGFFPPRHDDDANEKALLEFAVHDLGITHIDTAAAYGDSESLIGEVLEGLDRNRLFIASKIGIRPDNDIYGSIEASVKKLGTEPDVMYIHTHWGDETKRGGLMDKALEDLMKARAKGLIKGIGISNFQPEQLQYAIDALGGQLGFYQAKINPENPRGDAAQTLNLCHENGIVFVASSALDRRSIFDGKSTWVLNDIAKRNDMTPAQVALFGVRALGALPLVQSHNRARLQENAETTGKTMSGDDVERLNKIFLRQPKDWQQYIDGFTDLLQGQDISAPQARGAFYDIARSLPTEAQYDLWYRLKELKPGVASYVKEELMVEGEDNLFPQIPQ